MTEELTRYDQYINYSMFDGLTRIVSHAVVPCESGLQKHCVPHCQGDDNLSQSRAVLGWRYAH